MIEIALLYMDCQVSFACEDPECKAAFCYDCMKDYLQYGSTVA